MPLETALAMLQDDDRNIKQAQARPVVFLGL
jgi:hypothetical protein